MHFSSPESWAREWTCADHTSEGSGFAPDFCDVLNTSWRTEPRYGLRHQTHRCRQVAGFGHAILTGGEPGVNVPKAAEEVVASSGTTTQETLVVAQGS